MIMSAIKNRSENPPGRFEELVREMPPRAIMDDVDYQNTLDMIDRLMDGGKLTKGQELYLETLVQLVQVYEAAQYAIDTAHIKGLDLLRRLVAQSKLSASDLARLLGVHASMGSKILKGERALTVAHARTLGERFKLRFEAFLGA